MATDIEAFMFIMFNMHVCACMGHPHTPICTPTPIHLATTPQGGTLRISKNSITLELMKIFHFRLKI